MAAEVETLTLTISAGLLSALSTMAGVWLRSRIPQKTRVDNNPLIVKGAEDFVLKKDFDAHLENDDKIHERLFDLDRAREKSNTDVIRGFAQQLGAIEGKLDTVLKGKK